jgi:hypothetical protein
MSRGASEVAEYVAHLAGDQRNLMREPFSYGMRRDQARGELVEVYREHSIPKWDGADATPVTDETCRAAFRFLEALPADAPEPSIGVEPDGDITFEWYRNVWRTLSVSINESHDLHFAALLGSRKYHGYEPFFGEVPPVIRELVREVYAS